MKMVGRKRIKGRKIEESWYRFQTEKKELASAVNSIILASEVFSKLYMFLFSQRIHPLFDQQYVILFSFFIEGFRL